MIAVTGMHDGILIAVKNDRRDNVAGLGGVFQTALPHCDERRGKIVGGPAGEARMYADCRIQIGIGCPHDSGRGASG